MEIVTPDTTTLATVTLKPLMHKETMQIGIYFPLNFKLNNEVLKAKARWSNTNKCWYIPCTQEAYKKIEIALEAKATINADELKKYLQQKKKPPPTLKGAIQTPTLKGAKAASVFPPLGAGVSPNNQLQLQNFVQQLTLKAYSLSTIRTYRNEFTVFLTTLKKVDAESLTTQKIKDYLEYCFTALKLTENTIHSRMNALKFYYEQVLGREKFFWEIPRPKKAFILPKVLGEDELRKLFNSITYKKHKAILFTAYSAGLRVSEVVSLQIKHIDRSRMQLFIEKSKGKKDRYVGLSPVLLDILENYYKEIKPKPIKYLFEGQYPGNAYNARSAQKIFQIAKQKAGIKKEIGFHSLRHSFATHLLEKGIDIKYIKDLLGHFNIHTTERYLHVKKEKLINIISPFDDLWQKEEIEW